MYKIFTRSPVSSQPHGTLGIYENVNQLATLLIFYFPPDPSGGRMGTNLSYCIAIDAQGKSWIGQDIKECDPEDEDPVPESIDLDAYKFYSQESTLLTLRMLGGKPVNEWVAGQNCDRGCGNYGICLGLHRIQLIRMSDLP